MILNTVDICQSDIGRKKEAGSLLPHMRGRETRLLLLDVLADIERYRRYDDHTLDDVLPIGIHPDERKAVVDETEDDDTGNDTTDRSHTTGGGNSTDDAGRDGIELIPVSIVVGRTSRAGGFQDT